MYLAYSNNVRTVINRPIHRQLRLSAYIKRQQSNEDLIENLTEKCRLCYGFRALLKKLKFI